jgi:cation diffusion facilitator CzcD-associated flavoprotein CzcO
MWRSILSQPIIPWDQRLCFVPDGDLFIAIRSGKASVITDQIERFTENGLQLASGVEVEAEVVVMATGLQVQLLGGAKITVDRKRHKYPGCDGLQGHAGERFAQFCTCFWLHQCVLDPEG